MISTKLSALMSAKLVSTCDPNSEGGSKLTFIDRMDVVRLTSKVYRVQVDIPVNIARKVPIMPRICGPRPMYVSPVFTRQGKEAYQYFRSEPQE